MIHNLRNRLPSKYQIDFPTCDSSLKENQQTNIASKTQLQPALYAKANLSKLGSQSKRGLLSPNPSYNDKGQRRTLQFRDPSVHKPTAKQSQKQPKKDQIPLSSKPNTKTTRIASEVLTKDELPLTQKSNNWRNTNPKPLSIIGSALTLNSSASIPHYYLNSTKDQKPKANKSRDVNKSTEHNRNLQNLISGHERSNTLLLNQQPHLPTATVKQLNSYFKSFGSMEIELEDDRRQEHVNVPKHCLAHIQKIVSHLFYKESTQIRCADFQNRPKTDLPEASRTKFYDELIGVNRALKLRERTLFLALELIELYLASNKITADKIKLLAIACLFLVAKYEEIYPPKLDCFLKKLSSAVSKDDVLFFEHEVLAMIQFDMTRVISLDFFQIFLEIAEFDTAVVNFGMFILNLCAMEHSFYSCSNSLIAFGLCYFLHRLFKTAAFYDSRNGTEGAVFVLSVNRGKFEQTIGVRRDGFTLSFRQRDVREVSEGIYTLTQRFKETDCPNLFLKFQDDKFGCFSATKNELRG